MVEPSRDNKVLADLSKELFLYSSIHFPIAASHRYEAPKYEGLLSLYDGSQCFLKIRRLDRRPNLVGI
jgi:hypothetical protein